VVHPPGINDAANATWQLIAHKIISGLTGKLGIKRGVERRKNAMVSYYS
jgi:hypothetical protein